MGTETNVLKSVYSYLLPFAVKLNNPLMGTETNVLKSVYSYLLPFAVKLNNPLMGTETERPFHWQ